MAAEQTSGGAGKRMHALWWWIDRWRKSTAYTDMTLEQQGAYRNLLDEATLRGGPLPTDERILAKACGDAKRWPKLRAVLLARFTLTPDGWRNETLDEVLNESKRRADKQRRWRLSRGNATGNEAGNRGGSPDPDPISGSYKEQKDMAMANRVQEATDNVRTTTFVRRPLDVTPETEALELRAGHLLERYAELFILHRKGARYHNRMHLDFPKACEIVQTWADDARLEKLAILVLTTDDDWISRTDRGFGIFAAKAMWADDRLAMWEAEQTH
jgi:uncharacterized protein YdaU (DUF1376 family)